MTFRFRRSSLCITFRTDTPFKQQAKCLDNNLVLSQPLLDVDGHSQQAVQSKAITQFHVSSILRQFTLQILNLQMKYRTHVFSGLHSLLKIIIRNSTVAFPVQYPRMHRLYLLFLIQRRHEARTQIARGWMVCLLLT